MSHHSQSSYRVYILRSWLEGGGPSGEPPIRRYSLEDPQTRRRRGFADLQALIDFLAAEEGPGAVTLPPISATEEQKGGLVQKEEK